MILLVDNYDSFVYNLARYFELLGHPTHVVRNDVVKVQTVHDPQVDALVISPGPCAPDQAGRTLELLDQAIGKIPVLGVCLGHQAIVQSLGGRVIPSGKPVHGRTSSIQHDGQHEFAGLPNPLQVARYHSLIAEPSSLPDSLIASAKTDDGTIMAVRHQSFPVVGWQFHPESILTESGFAMLAGFLKTSGIPAESIPEFANELPLPARPTDETWPKGVTF